MTDQSPLITKLLLIDLDGTARETVSGEICPTYPTDQQLIPQTATTCEALSDKGWMIAGVTNQGGCEAINPATGKPYKTHRQAVKECKHFLELAPWCDRVYMCPNGKKSNRDEVYRINRSGWLWSRYWVTHEHNEDHPYYQTRGYRKPKPGMLELAIRDQYEHECTEARNWGVKGDDLLIKVQAVMVGDMESDEKAANTIDVPYLSVEDFSMTNVLGIAQ